jgi:hypothetical protein
MAAPFSIGTKDHVTQGHMTFAKVKRIVRFQLGRKAIWLFAKE